MGFVRDRTAGVEKVSTSWYQVHAVASKKALAGKGVCVGCGTPVPPEILATPYAPRQGWSCARSTYPYCPPCTHTRNESPSRRRALARLNRNHAEWREAGLCLQCGKIPKDGLKHCQICLAAASARAERRRVAGICRDCGAPGAAPHRRCPPCAARHATRCRALRARKKAEKTLPKKRVF